MLKALWAYRGFILGSVKREFQSKYRNSMLGAAWTIINPLAMILVYTLIFSQVMRAKLPGVQNAFAYSIYLCSGILTWGLFAEIVSRGQNVFLENANMLKKMHFPRICLPIIVICSALINFAIIFGLFIIFLLLTGSFPGLPFLAFFPLLLVLVLFSIGLGVTLGVLNVFFSDVGQFFGIFLTFWFWLTPIVYPASILPENIKSLTAVNPMYGLMEGFHSILVNAQWPCLQALWPSTMLAVLFCVIGFYLFRKLSGEMVDEL